jgi:uncharacterized protein (TIGR00255 family)
MMRSMTGFGKGSAECAAARITIELRSLNSKGLDLSLRCPSTYREREMDWRKKVGDAVVRGKVDVNIHREARGHEAVGLPAEWLETAMQSLQTIAGEPVSRGDLLAMALRLPAPSVSENTLPEEWVAVEAAMDQALADFDSFRLREGAALAEDLAANIGAIQRGLEEVPAMEEERVAQLKARLQRGLEGIEYDTNRYEQELIYYLEKLDVNEEKVRLQAHLTHFLEAMQEGQGRKLGFISQEIGREVNTLGSKSNHAAMQRVVVQMKEELEKIKEQSLNVL